MGRRRFHNRQITGTTSSVEEAHYVKVKAVSGDESDTMTFILIAGSQSIYYTDGIGGNLASLQASLAVLSGGDVLIIPDGTYTGCREHLPWQGRRVQ
jgi:hypothetical protein